MRFKKRIFLGMIYMICLSAFGQFNQGRESFSVQFGFYSEEKKLHSARQEVPLWTSGGYGFDFGTAKAVRIVDNAMIADASVYFSVSVTPGNYLISVNFVSRDTSDLISVKAESKRLMTGQIQSGKATNFSHEFIVHIQNKWINSTEEVRLKPRDVVSLNWDSKLTLEFTKGTAVKRIRFTKLDSIPTLFLAGDSTVADQDLSPWASWGQFITQYFNTSVSVANYAASGASLASFKSRKRWKKILSLLKKGDFVMIEFGHNDQKAKGEGRGPWTSYTDLLREYVNSARAKGAVPILLTPLQRRVFDHNGNLIPTHGDYPKAVRAVAKSLSVPLIDLTKLSTVLYEAWGEQYSKNAFVHYPANSFPGQHKALMDNTHFNDFGANEIALCVVSGIKDLNIELASYLKPVIDYDPRNPNQFENWSLPMSPRFETKKPEGN